MQVLNIQQPQEPEQDSFREVIMQTDICDSKTITSTPRNKQDIMGIELRSKIICMEILTITDVEGNKKLLLLYKCK